ncbi:unnamed protein product, partial [Meganyctiphanes norvegica]
NYNIYSGGWAKEHSLTSKKKGDERWSWENGPEFLRKLELGSYETGAVLPDEMVEKLQKSRKANAGGFNLRQIVLASFDQAIHTRGEADTKSFFAKTYVDIMGIEPIPNTNMPANFGHLAGGYDAQYYGYLVSEILN